MKNLRLLGETNSVEKNSDVILKESTQVGDMINMAFATTVVANGHGEGIVTDIGMGTMVGKIANLILQDEAPETPLQIKLRRSRKKIGTSCTWDMFYNFCNWITKTY